jgi:hypothetical protein
MRSAWMNTVMVALVVGCSAKTPDAFVLHATGGLDSAPFAGDPKVVRVELRVRDDKGAERVVASADPAAGSLDVPDSVRSAGVGSLVLAGLGEGSTVVTYGRTPLLALEGIDNNPLTILVQRPSTLTRAVKLVNAVQTPRATMLGAQYLVVSDPADKTLAKVNLLTWHADEEVDALDRVPATLAIAGTRVLAIDAAGVASLYSAGTTTVTHPVAPDGGTFADVIGGAVILAEDASAYVVGATRAATPTDVVLRLGDDGTLSFKHLLRARTGATATWVTGRGLVVLGGTSPTGADPPGVELLATGQTTAIALAFPGDGKTKTVAAASGGSIVRIDAAGVVDTFDLSCTASCFPIVNGAKAETVASRDDDAALALDAGVVLAVRGGKLVRIDVAKGTALALSDLGPSPASLTLLSTGAAAIVVGSDPVVRTVR